MALHLMEIVEVEGIARRVVKAETESVGKALKAKINDLEAEVKDVAAKIINLETEIKKGAKTPEEKKKIGKSIVNSFSKR